MTEGVVKFEVHHDEQALPAWAPDSLASLLGWRSILVDTALIGQEGGRYGGAGYGNISVRVGPRSAARGRRSFLVSGTQTSGRRLVDISDFALVDRYDVGRNIVHSRGLVRPSSESMTHAAIYDHGPHIQCVLHVHAPDIWRSAARLGLAQTPADVEYGTPDMARAFEDILRRRDSSIVVMRGHEDGVVAFGRDADEAGVALVTTLAASRAAV